VPVSGEYEPSPSQWVRDQVAEYEESGGTRANTLLDTGLPIVIITTRGNRALRICAGSEGSGLSLALN
jgi:hypothetical protein